MMAMNGNTCTKMLVRSPDGAPTGGAPIAVTSPRIGCIVAPKEDRPGAPWPKVAGSYALAPPFAIVGRPIGRAMAEDIAASLRRIADALERFAPPAAPDPSFDGARVFRHDGGKGRFLPAPDFLLPLDLLVGVDRQKARLLECLER